MIASAVVLAAVATMVALALWQLRRLDQVRSANDRVRARLSMATAPLDVVLPAGGAADAATYRRVEVSGRYDPTEEVQVDNRSDRGRAGKHLLTPLVTASGRAVLVDRGWITLDTDRAAAEVRPPSEQVRVVGVLFPGERKGVLGPSLPPEGHLSSVPRIDVARLAKQLPYTSVPLYLRLESQAPSQASALPKPPGLPPLDDGPHLSYAVQWFLFATVAISVFGALIRREGRRRLQLEG